MGFYVESADRPYQSRLASEDIHVGTLVNENGSDAYELTDDSKHSTVEALATAPRRGDYIAKEDDKTTTFKYLSSENDRVPGLPLADRDVVKVRTVLETNSGVTSAPSISDGDVVGVVDTSDANAPTSAGRIVEEGYTNDENDDSTSTTFNRSNSNFIPLGKAYRDESTSFDEPVRVRVERDL